MRLSMFQHGGKVRPGLVLGDDMTLDLRHAHELAETRGFIATGSMIPNDLVDLISDTGHGTENCEIVQQRALGGDLDPACYQTGAITRLAPVPRPSKNVFCVGKNYAAHVAEGNRAQQISAEKIEYPIFFTKPPTAVIGPDEAIRVDSKVSDKMDYEVELALIIGRAGYNIPADRALEHVFGFTIINDVSARDIQRRHGGQFFKGKALDTSCPMGPDIITVDELPDFDNLSIRLSVNGDLRQDGNTADMMFNVPVLIESLSHGMTLEPGDILATGTPSGVGYAMEPPCFLRHGDVVSCEIEKVGTLTNPVLDINAGDARASREHGT